MNPSSGNENTTVEESSGIFPNTFPMGFFSVFLNDEQRQDSPLRTAASFEEALGPTDTKEQAVSKPSTGTLQETHVPLRQQDREHFSRQHLSQNELDDVMQCFNKQRRHPESPPGCSVYDSSQGSTLTSPSQQRKPRQERPHRSSWTPLSLLHQDPSAYKLIRKISDLFIIFRVAKNHSSFDTRFRELRRQLIRASKAIHKTHSSSRKRKDLDTLYKRAIQSFRALVHMAEMTEDIDDPQGCTHYMHFMPAYEIIYRQHIEDIKAERPGIESPSDADHNRAMQQMLRETRFEAYMREWLRKHWKNPEPKQEEDLLAMSNATSFEKEFIVSWLVHIREHEWKPASQKARALRRPPSVYEEDSIKLYLGRPLRRLPPSANPRPPLHPGPRRVPKPYKGDLEGTWSQSMVDERGMRR